MELEWDVKDEINFEINENILSESFCRTESYVISDCIREIMLISLYIDYRLTICLMLKVIDRLRDDYYETFFDIFQ